MSERVLPKVFYGDPAECLDEIRRMRAAADRAARRLRAHKARRIRALVREVLRNGGGGHGKR